ncbi:unnamed protein product [Caenorhabditis auriculariae]|uniref:Uncharacterized protein n=1 Tax=Caenorhabditis auriculariae TaxID=2777116 RepID=A0A8S1HAD9_9PELO|nr:unnamed protein product [Caenorhabditis auriculariae]
MPSSKDAIPAGFSDLRPGIKGRKSARQKWLAAAKPRGRGNSVQTGGDGRVWPPKSSRQMKEEHLGLVGSMSWSDSPDSQRTCLQLIDPDDVAVLTSSKAYQVEQK